MLSELHLPFDFVLQRQIARLQFFIYFLWNVALRNCNKKQYFLLSRQLNLKEEIFKSIFENSLCAKMHKKYAENSINRKTF